MDRLLPCGNLTVEKLRLRGRSLTAVRHGLLFLVLAVSACHGGATPPQLAALREGRDAATPCRERFHEESTTYADCARYVAQQAAGNPRYQDWRRLGALTTGWVSADMVGQQGDAPADSAARQLLGEALQLQRRLGARDADLCELVGLPCAAMGERRRVLLAEQSSAGP